MGIERMGGVEAGSVGNRETLGIVRRCTHTHI